jgi:hypothetical protein
MRIVATNAPARTAASSSPRRVGEGGFSVGEEGAAKATQSAASLRTIGGIDALLALQGEQDPVERRRRAVKRGRNALDALDALKIALLDGTLGPSTLMRLRSVATGLREATGDAGLDAVLGEIELRLEVELAKISAQR